MPRLPGALRCSRNRIKIKLYKHMPVESVDYYSQEEYQQALAQEEAEGQWQQEQMWA